MTTWCTTDISKFSKFEISNSSSDNDVDQSSASDNEMDKLQWSINSGTETEDDGSGGKSIVEEIFMLPSVGQVGQVGNPTEPEEGCSPRFIIDRVNTGMLMLSQ